MKNILLVTACVLLVFIAGFWVGQIDTPASSTSSKHIQTSVIQKVVNTMEDNWAIFEEAELMEQLDASGRPYLPFFKNNTLSTGIYVLKKGAEDGQQPHKLDEVYYTLEGKAKFTVDGTTVDVKPGTILFVKAHIDHKFHDMEEDLKLLVFFSNAGTE